MVSFTLPKGCPVFKYLNNREISADSCLVNGGALALDYGPRVRFEALLVNCIVFVTAAFGSITVVRTDIWSSDTDVVRSLDLTDDVLNKITAYPSRTLTEGMRI